MEEQFQKLHQAPEVMSREDIANIWDIYNLPGLSFIQRQGLDREFAEKEVRRQSFN